MLNRCIWCHYESPNRTFTSVSHILPQCFGNKEWILPVGVVCDHCNHFFGSLEKKFRDQNPTFKVIAFGLQLKHPRTNKLIQPYLFDWKYPAPGVKSVFNVNMHISDKSITLSINHTTYNTHPTSSKGEETYLFNIRNIKFISRAVHKIAFESLAYMIFAKITAQTIDIFDPRLDPIRKWARLGQPYAPSRPVIRRQSIDMGKKADFGPLLVHKQSSDSLFMQLDVYGDFYGVSLTSLPNEAYEELKSYAIQDIDFPTWCMGERFQKLN